MNTTKIVGYSMMAIIIVVSSFILGCGQRNPASFWLSFMPQLIVKKGELITTGGGYSWIHWSSELPDTFSREKVVSWASEQDWIFKTCTSYAKDEVRTWKNRIGESHFPLFEPNYKGYLFGGHYNIEPFPLFIIDDLDVIQFDTGLFRSDHTTSWNPAFGYVAISKSRKAMTLYFLFGETPSPFK